MKMLRHIVLIALFGAALATAVDDRSGASITETITSRPPIDDVDYFDCSGQHGTYHPHPWECTRFIQCHNSRAADQPCADCAAGDPRCPEGYLNWDKSITVCNWPDVTPCTPGPRPTSAPEPTTGIPPKPTTVIVPEPTTAAPEPTTVAPKPTTAAPEPTTAAPEPTTVAPKPTTAAPEPTTVIIPEPTEAATEAATTEEATVKPTAAPPTDAPTTRPPVGEVCDPDNCDVEGDCHGYSFCQRIISPAGPRNDTGVVVPGDCGDLYYNPTASAGSPIAVCDLWRDLDEATQDKYREDPTCDPYCELIPQGNCANAYIYRDPTGAESNRNCPAGTILDVEVRRCVDPCKASASAKCEACK